MNFSFFGWLRAKAKEAIFAGLSDAIDQLDTDDSPDLDALQKWLAAATAKQLPAASPDDEPPRGKGRGK